MEDSFKGSITDARANRTVGRMRDRSSFASLQTMRLAIETDAERANADSGALLREHESEKFFKHTYPALSRFYSWCWAKESRSWRVELTKMV